MPKFNEIHAGREAGEETVALCGQPNGRISEPGDTVNCPSCRVTLNHIRQAFPEHAGYSHWGLSPADARRAAQDMAEDMRAGADD